jgi:hypothetical protein
MKTFVKLPTIARICAAWIGNGSRIKIRLNGKCVRRNVLVKRAALILTFGLVACGTYVSSFYAYRKTVSLSFFIEPSYNGRMLKSVTLYYFSLDARSNRLSAIPGESKNRLKKVGLANGFREQLV